ncbi:MAG: right-handed parallel beta-helix repeat-containing protein, partial [bacterium]|nr:right-handed parallel beta-helix repeat-containing protein [bacterium]
MSAKAVILLVALHLLGKTSFRRKSKMATQPTRQISVYLMVAIVIALLTVNHAAYAATKYVSLSGNDNWSGDQGAPWRTITYAATQAQAGDTIRIEGGNYGHEHVVISNSGIEGSHIILEGYVNGSDELPLIDGQDRTGNGIYLGSKSYVEIKNVNVTQYQYGIYASYSTYVTLDGMDISSLGNTGWDGFGIFWWYSDHCNIRNCAVTDAGAVNVWLRYSHYNFLNNCRLYYTNTSNPTDYNLVIGYGHDNTIQNCLSQDQDPQNSRSGH